MNMIVAADKKNGIGYKGKLLVTIPFDQQLFRKETIGKVVVKNSGEPSRRTCA